MSSRSTATAVPLTALCSTLLVGVLLAGAAHAQSFTLAPNPYAGGPLTLRYTADAAAEPPVVDAYDVLGRRVDPSAALPAGTYLLRLRYPDGEVSPAQPLIRLTSGPLDVRLVPDAALAGTAAGTAAGTSGEAAAAGCSGNVVWDGRRHARLGRAVLAPAADHLAVSNIRSRGLDGVRTCLGEASGAAVLFAGLDLLQQRRALAAWDLDSDGALDNGGLAHASFQEAGGHVDAVVDLAGVGAPSVTIEVWDDTDLVHVATVPGPRLEFELAPGPPARRTSTGEGGVVLRAMSLRVTDTGGEAAGGAASGGDYRAEGVVDAADYVVWRLPGDEVGHVGSHAVIRAAAPLAGVVRESRMRFARHAGEIEILSLSAETMSHFHRVPLGLDKSSPLLFDVASPSGPLAVECASPGCPPLRGVEVMAPPGTGGLHAGLQTVTIPPGSDATLSTWTDYSGFDPDLALAVPVEPLGLQVEGAPGGVVLRMEKENCDELGATDECVATFEYVQNGVVRRTETVPMGVGVYFEGALRIHSVTTRAGDDEGGGSARKPITWEVALRVRYRRGVEIMRFSGTGTTPATIGSLSLVGNERAGPLRIEAVESCAPDEVCGGVAAPETVVLDE